jgi:hypothetical protein
LWGHEIERLNWQWWWAPCGAWWYDPRIRNRTGIDRG